jgi:hypothetical protein
VQAEEATGCEAQGGRWWRQSRVNCLPRRCYLFLL